MTQKVKVAVYCLVYLGESFSLNLIAQATISLEIVTPTRASLIPEKVEQLIVIK